LTPDSNPTFEKIMIYNDYLVGGLELFFSHSVGNVIIPTDELIFFRGVGIPPASYSWLFQVL
jgi:hypothetical protein